MLLFHPKPEHVSTILDDLMDPDLSMRDVAKRHSTTIDALSAWLAEPSIRERLELVNNASAQRTRLTANLLLPNAMTTLNRIVTHPQELIAPDATPEHRRRASETLRRASHLLLRLANFNPRPLRNTIDRSDDPIFQPSTSTRPIRSRDLARVAAEVLHPSAPFPASFSSPSNADINRTTPAIPPASLPTALSDLSTLSDVTAHELSLKRRTPSGPQSLAALAGNLGFSTPKTTLPRTG